MGYNGYEIDIAPGLVPDAKIGNHAFAEIVKEISKNFIVRGGDQYDTVILNGLQKSVAFIVGTMQLGQHVVYRDHQTGAISTSMNTYSQMTTEDKERYLGLLVEDISRTVQKDITREVVRISGRPVAIVTEQMTQFDLTLYVYATCGKLNDIYILIGVSDSAYAADTKDSMDNMIKSLKVL